jgi:cytidine deaminase
MYVGGAKLEGMPGFDAHHLFVQAVPYMVDQARYAAHTEAYSYRGLLVGVTGFFVNPNTQETALLTAGNLKARRTKTKVCAEQKVLNMAQKAGFLEAIGLVVSSTTDVELIAGITEAPTPTLHPCTSCRQLFDTHPLMRDETVVITTGLELDIYQVHNHEQMRELYRDEDYEALGRVHGNGFGDWSRKVAAYDVLAAAEAGLAESEQRSHAKLAQMAIQSPGPWL